MPKSQRVYGRYQIIRYYEDKPNRILRKNVTENEAIEHCNRPETSSSTSKRIHAQDNGRWFDGYRLMGAGMLNGNRMGIMEQIFVANTADRIQAVLCRRY